MGVSLCILWSGITIFLAYYDIFGAPSSFGTSSLSTMSHKHMLLMFLNISGADISYSHQNLLIYVKSPTASQRLVYTAKPAYSLPKSQETWIFFSFSLNLKTKNTITYIYDSNHESEIHPTHENFHYCWQCKLVARLEVFTAAKFKSQSSELWRRVILLSAVPYHLLFSILHIFWRRSGLILSHLWRECPFIDKLQEAQTDQNYMHTRQ